MYYLKRLLIFTIFTVFIFAQKLVYSTDEDWDARPPITSIKMERVKIYDNCQVKIDQKGRPYIGNSTEPQSFQDPREPDTIAENAFVYNLRQNIKVPFEKNLEDPNCNIEVQKRFMASCSSRVGSNHTAPQSFFELIGLKSRGDKLQSSTIVQDPTIWPWLVHSHMVVSFKNTSKHFLSNGIMISNSCILTNAHNVYDDVSGVAEQITFCVGMCEGNALAFDINGKREAKFKAGKVMVNRRYCELKKQRECQDEELWANDYAVVYLDYPLGKHTGIASFGPQPNTQVGSSIKMCVYPIILNGQVTSSEVRMEEGKETNCKLISLHQRLGKVTKLSNGYIHHNMETEKGDSGSSILYLSPSNETPHCLGLHSYGPHHEGNIATLLTQDSCKNIRTIIGLFEKEMLLANARGSSLNLEILNELGNDTFNDGILIVNNKYQLIFKFYATISNTVCNYWRYFLDRVYNV